MVIVMGYKIGDTTLIHTCGFDILAFMNIMKHGIMSYDYAVEHGIPYFKNYHGSNLGDTISCVRPIYSNEEVFDSAYELYVKHGISFFLEGVPFIYDKEERFIHRMDEVLVKDYIPVSKIKGILIPEEYVNLPLHCLPYIRKNATSYPLIKHKTDYMRKFFVGNGEDIQVDYYNDIYNELYYIHLAYEKSEKEEERQYLKSEHVNVIHDLNELLGNDVERYFRKVLNKENVTILDIIDFVNDKELHLDVYRLKSNEGRVR